MCEVIRRTMSCRVEVGLHVKKLGKNVLLFSFDRAQDRLHVFRLGPWYFDKFLLVLEMMDVMVQPAKMCFNKVAFWVPFFISRLVA